MKTRQIVVVLTVLAIIGGSAGIMQLLSTFKEEPKQEKKEKIVKYVKTEPVNYKDVNTQIVTYGRVETTMPLAVIAEGQGRMLTGSIPLKQGQKFRKGQVLFKVDDSEPRFRLQADKASFMKDVASILPTFKIDFPDSYPVWQSFFNNIDVAKKLPALPQHKSTKEKTFLATKNIFTNYYRIKSTETNLGKYVYYAPFSGSITEVSLHIGSFVNPGTRVAKISQSKSLELNIAVNPQDIQWVKKGSKVNIDTEDGMRQWTGEVVRISDVINKNTQSLDVYVKINASSDHPVYDGMYLRATIPGIQVNDALAFPRNALLDNSMVYVVKDDVLKLKEVKVHKITNETAIISGVTEGEDIVVEPLINAYENMPVKRLDDANQSNNTMTVSNETEGKKITLK